MMQGYGFGAGVLAGLLIAGGISLLWAPPQPRSAPGAPPASVDGSAVIATVDGEPITSQSLLEEMARRGRAAPGLFDDPVARRALLDERIRFETVAARARAAGYERDPALGRQWKQLLVRRYEADQLDARLAALRVSDADVERYYAEHLEDYTRPERRRVAMIFIALPRGASRERVEALTREAESVHAEARANASAHAHFGDLARVHSDDRATRHVGGDVGWISAGQSSYRWTPAVVEASFALSELREVSPLVRTKQGFYLLKLSDLERALPRALQAIRPTIRHTLLDARRRRLREDFYAELAAETRIELDLDALEALPAPEGLAAVDPRRRAPSLPGG